VVDVPGSARRAVVAVARLRAALDALGPLFEPAPPVAIGATLDWLAGELAQLDALDSLLGSVCDARPLMGGPGERALVARVDAARTRARARVLRALRDRRYAQLLQRLAALAAGPATASSAGRRRATSAAGKFVRGHWRPVRDGASADSPTLQPAVDQLAAALELAASVTSPDATAALERVALLQEAAAEHADAVAVAARLRAFARRAESVESWAAGVVTGLQMARGEDAATRFAQIRQTLAQKSAWSWTE
jgi:CHAD domain-containing protein